MEINADIRGLLRFAAFLALLATPFRSFAREGTPYYYQNAYSPQYNQVPTKHPGQNVYVGNQPSRQIVGQRSYSYQVPRQQANPYAGGAMTPNGVSIPNENNPYDLKLSAAYARKYADFAFETGVQSILQWNDMVINEIILHAEKDFNLRGYSIFAFGEYARGTLSHGGMSMDYDLKPYDDKRPDQGIFTISMGGQSGSMQNMKVGIGARNIWDISGWKISPIIGYQIFKHDMKMDNHVYPNPPVYIPLMDQNGNYVFSSSGGDYISVAPGTGAPDGYYQVCMSPEDLALAAVGSNGHPMVDGNGDLLTTEYNPYYPYVPWGVGPNECVVVGGDGMIIVNGVTHIYNTTWSGLYLGLEVEKQMTYVDKLRFYAQVSMPHYRSEGIWPNRSDWQQNPSFVDEGDNGAMHYQMEMEYVYQFSDRIQLSLKADMNYFHVGQIPGELYVAEYSYYVLDENGELVYDMDAFGNEYPRIATQQQYTEKISDSLRWATWLSFGLHLGAKYAF